MKLNKNLTVLFFVMIVVNLGFGIVLPILPFYVESFGTSASGLGLLMAIFSIMQFIFAPIFGNLSDHYGRKGILMLGIFGNGVSLLLFGLSTELWMLYASRALAGILSSATLPTAMAYVGDSTSEENRGGGMGIMGAAMGLGVVLGPGIGGWLGSIAIKTPFFFAASLSIIALAMVFFILPESLPAEQRSKGVKLQGPQLGFMWKALTGSLGFMFFLAFLMNFGLTSFEGVFALYAEKRFSYGSSEVGIIMMVLGVISAIIQGLLTGPITRKFGEEWIIITNLVGSAVTFVLMLLAFDFPTVLITVGLFNLSNAMLRPSVSSLISRRSEYGQGSAMGLANSFMSLGRIAGPLLGGLLFDLNLNLPYLVSAGIMLVSFFLSLIWLKKTGFIQNQVQPQQMPGR